MHQFTPGQVWRYQARSVEPDSTLNVCKVEAHPQLGKVIHVQAQGLRIKNPRHGSGFSEVISHVPIAEAALAQSVTELVGTTHELPDYEEGYHTWQENQGGVFTISVAECVQLMEQAING